MSDDYFLARLTREAHAAELQALYDRCSDYLEVHFGVPQHPTAAEEDFTDDRNLVYGIYSRQSEMIGVLEMMRDYPKPDEWWIGMLMFDPSSRGRGLGQRVCDSTFDSIRREGGLAVWIAVLEHNERAQKFWKRIGFEEMERQKYVASNGHESRVVLMKRPT